MIGTGSMSEAFRRVADMVDEAGADGQGSDQVPHGRAPYASGATQPKQRHIRVKTFEEESLEDLEAAYDEWRLDAEEDGFVDWQFEVHTDADDTVQFVLVILYTE